MFTGEEIRKKRKALKLSAESLADQLQVSKENLYKWEKGHRPTNPEDYIKVENWLSGKLETVPLKTVSGGNSNDPVVNKDLSSLIESNLTMSRSIEKNSNSLADLVQMLKEKSVPINSGLHEVADLQREMLAMLKAAIVKDAEYKAAGNQEEGRKILREINKATAEHLGMNKKTDIPVPSKKSR